jgi:DNA-binding transcriptional MerR regulator
MTIGRVARLAGLSPRAVRFYEAEGLLPRAPRTVSGYRIYSERELDLLRLVVELRRVGLSVADVREVIRQREHGVPPPDRVVALLEARISGVVTPWIESSLHFTKHAADLWSSCTERALELDMAQTCDCVSWSVMPEPARPEATQPTAT